MKAAVLGFLLVALYAEIPGVPARPRSNPPAVLRVEVRDSATGRALENAEVTDLASTRTFFTDSAGTAYIVWPASGSLRLRIRELGFRPVERIVSATQAGPSALAIRLARIVVQLEQVRATTRCPGGRDAGERFFAAGILEQMRQNAERFDALRRERPFRVTLERKTSTLVGGNSRVLRTSTEETDADRWGEPYRTGKVLQETGLGISVPILFLSALADLKFLENHCFSFAGNADTVARGEVRLDFTPVSDLHSIDWAGTATFDSATGSLLKVDFHLVGLTRRNNISRLEGYTTFVTVSPYIVIPDSTVAAWWRTQDRSNDTSPPDVVQLLRRVKIRFTSSGIESHGH